MEGWMSSDLFFGLKYVKGTHKQLYGESCFAPKEQEGYLKRYWTEFSEEKGIQHFVTYEVYEPSGRVWEETYQKL